METQERYRSSSSTSFISRNPIRLIIIYIAIYWSTQTAILSISWWRHQMETFSAVLAICAGNSPVPGEFPSQRPVTRSFDVFFDLRLNKQLSKQSWGWWFETLPRPSWRHSNVVAGMTIRYWDPMCTIVFFSLLHDCHLLLDQLLVWNLCVNIATIE